MILINSSYEVGKEVMGTILTQASFKRAIYRASCKPRLISTVRDLRSCPLPAWLQNLGLTNAPVEASLPYSHTSSSLPKGRPSAEVGVQERLAEAYAAQTAGLWAQTGPAAAALPAPATHAI